jgi:hypothetical protein
MLFFDGLEQALVGKSEVWIADGARAIRAVYSANKMIEIFESQGMSFDEAVEWIIYNVEGAYMGESTPVVFWDYKPEFDED